MKNRIKQLGLLLVGLAFSVGSFSEVWAAGFNAQTLNPALGPENILTVDGTQTSGKWKPLAQGLFEWAYRPLVFINPMSGAIDSLHVPHMSTLHLMGGLGFTSWFQLGLDIPIVLYQGAPSRLDGASGIGPVPFPFGIGDIRLVAKFRLLQNQEGGFGIAAVPQFLAPTGVGISYRGNDAFVLEPIRFAFEYRSQKGAFVALNLSFLFRTSDQWFGETMVSHQFRFGIGGYVPVLKSVGIFAELTGAVGLINGPRTYAPFESSAGVRWIDQKTSISVSGGFALAITQTPGTAHRIFLGVGWAPMAQIQKEPPPRREPPPPSDRDRDGLIDPIDDCPDEPGPKDLNGCPDRDLDKIPDRKDKCPDTPGLPEFEGCADRDKDGLPDPQDECPEVPGPKELKGCPDSDQDEIPDNLDKCPDKAGPKPEGCPLERKYISITQQKIVLLQKILFATNQDKIRPGSYPLLDEVVAVLKERPLMKILIEGHTDNRGQLEYNIELSRKRAKAVLDYLVQHGIEPSRLSSEGYGPTRPIADNATPEGQDKNRRTEFTILHQ